MGIVGSFIQVGSTINDIPSLHKRACYTPDLIPATISVASKNSVSTLTTPYDSPQLLLVTSYDINHRHAMKKYEPYRGRVKIGYCSRKYDKKYATKIQGYIAPRALIKIIKLLL